MYFKSATGENCLVDQVIDSWDTCEAAAAAFAWPLQTSGLRTADDPAGCNGYTYHTKTIGFNGITDPLQTDPQAVKTGICTNSRTH